MTLGSAEQATPASEELIPPVAPEVEGQEVEAGTDKEQVEHEPPQDHPRFKAIYGKMKALEREREADRERIKAIAEHNKKLMDSISSVEDRIIDSQRPDPSLDPDAHAKWLEDKSKRAIEKATQPKEDFFDSPKPATNEKIVMQEDMLREIYDDYDSVVLAVNREMQNNELLYAKIMGSKNPPLAAYKYHQEMIAGKKNARSKMQDQAYVEGSHTPPPADKQKRKLTNDEKSVYNRMFRDIMSEEDYLKQIIVMEKRGEA